MFVLQVKIVFCVYCHRLAQQMKQLDVEKSGSTWKFEQFSQFIFMYTSKQGILQPYLQ